MEKERRNGENINIKYCMGVSIINDIRINLIHRKPQIH
jgi:hypothetical protein